jgi:uncharacterized protein (TIGR03435 family)
MIRAMGVATLIASLGSSGFCQSTADARSPNARLEFEVASIKPSVMPGGRGMIRIGGRGGPGSADPSRATYNFSSLRDLLMDAYSMKRHQIAGPDWLDAQRFDVVAKVPDGATKEQVRIMLQNLLADRFKLAVHRETKELPMYALVVGGGKGPRLKESAVADAPPAANPASKDGESPGPMGGLKIGADGCPETPAVMAIRPANFQVMTPNGACMISNGQSIPGLADQLSNQFDRPVVDMTGLKGKYDIKLRFDPSSMPGLGGMGGMMKGAPMPADGMPARRGDGTGRDPNAEEREPAPSIFAALQEQLGLKLEARKGSVDLLVVDHIEKTPTEN